nr:uncharacterized protein LOC129476875 [Symphalangus syndactylus]
MKLLQMAPFRPSLAPQMGNSANTLISWGVTPASPTSQSRNPQAAATFTPTTLLRTEGGKACSEEVVGRGHPTGSSPQSGPGLEEGKKLDCGSSMPSRAVPGLATLAPWDSERKTFALGITGTHSQRQGGTHRSTFRSLSFKLFKWCTAAATLGPLLQVARTQMTKSKREHEKQPQRAADSLGTVREGASGPEAQHSSHSGSTGRAGVSSKLKQEHFYNSPTASAPPPHPIPQIDPGWTGKGLRTSPASLGRSCSSWTEKRGRSSPANLTRAPRKQKKPPFFLVTPQPPLSFWVPSCSKRPQLPGDSAWTTTDHRRTDTRACLQAELCPSVLQSPSLHNEDVACTSHGGCREDEGRGSGSHLHSFCPPQVGHVLLQPSLAFLLPDAHPPLQPGKLTVPCARLIQKPSPPPALPMGGPTSSQASEMPL